MRVTRHFVDVAGRRVHFRSFGSGPPLLMIHQSPRSSAELEPLMLRWGEHFTCIAPDTPGFGHSAPLPDTRADLSAFGDALISLLDTLGIARIAAYGFHSGGAILVSAVRRHPKRFSGLAIGGYPVWTPEERALFKDSYLPPFLPSPFGEHLTWLWNRVLEQTWFFPWFQADDSARLSLATDDPDLCDEVVRDFLDSGDAYRIGYGAVMQATSDIPPPGASFPPVVIAAFDGDPLQEHLSRLGDMPAGWRAQAVATPKDLEMLSLSHLIQHADGGTASVAEAADEGFVAVAAAGYDGLIHWRGSRASLCLFLHAPAGECPDPLTEGSLAIDLPGHGLSDDWPSGVSPDLRAWASVSAAAVAELGAPVERVEGEGLSALLAAETAFQLGATAWSGLYAHLPLPADADDWLARAVPDMSPDRFGCHLARGWSAVRASHFFWPWFAARPQNARAFDPAEIAPERLAREHRALVRAVGAQRLLEALLCADRENILAKAPPLQQWSVARWAEARSDMWRPADGEPSGV